MLVAPTEVAVYEGGADRAFFMIVLTSEPTSDVTITVSGMEPTAERSTAGTRTTAVSSRLDPQITITANSRHDLAGVWRICRLTVKRDAAGNRPGGDGKAWSRTRQWLADRSHEVTIRAARFVG